MYITLVYLIGNFLFSTMKDDFHNCAFFNARRKSCEWWIQVILKHGARFKGNKSVCMRSSIVGNLKKNYTLLIFSFSKIYVLNTTRIYDRWFLRKYLMLMHIT